MQIALGLSHPLTVPRTCLTRLLSPGSFLKWAADWFFPIRALPPLMLKAGLCVVLMGAAPNPWIEALVKRNILAPLGKWSFYTCVFWTSQLWCIMCCCCFQPTSGKQVITWCLCGCLRVWSRLLLTDGLFFLELFFGTCTLCKVNVYFLSGAAEKVCVSIKGNNNNFISSISFFQ